ncbi:IS3 family transposase [Apilactobacillus apisilvae]|uniref:IS3 family transposase n=1 Tax=Apilactobacillus apisilvae TaxID=2923364 RepID=A0ABY4PIX7_9LACO|nr:IS3 family transposase [Apilactobacillus apisilvae]UQS85709.1 IS3 family transposase [Apilactobacillus apisilvae]
MSNKVKAQFVYNSWSANNFPYTLNVLLKVNNLKRSTYYDELKRIKNYKDKYAKVKEQIKLIFKRSKMTYGHRRIKCILDKIGFNYCLETVRKLMKNMRLQPTMYNNRRKKKYSSYRGNIGKIHPNILHQNFKATMPYQILHTDITQLKLKDHSNGYISAIIDEGTKEILSIQVSDSPNQQLIYKNLKDLKNKIPAESNPIMHSDQGWHYQLPYYTSKLKKMNIKQSMSRKGNCLDNAPIESFFSLLKREYLNNFEIKNIEMLTKLTKDYLNFFNNQRISLKTKGMTPIEYRNHSIKNHLI